MARDADRTRGLLSKNQALYQLSYTGFFLLDSKRLIDFLSAHFHNASFLYRLSLVAFKNERPQAAGVSLARESNHKRKKLTSSARKRMAIFVICRFETEQDHNAKH